MGEKSAIRKKDYLEELDRLTVELVKLQEWVKAKQLKVVAIFEGRDAAGKGGVIKAITSGLNPRYARIAALTAPTEKEKTQWYFQRYAAQLPSGGEMVFFDRSWYNRAGVEKVMGFCSDVEYREFARSVPEFEGMLIRSGIILVKYWFSVSDEMQEDRFKDRLEDPAKRWKLSPMDMSARSRWVDYSRAKDAMFEFSDLPDSPWHVVDADDKYCARLNTILHFLGQIPFKDLTPEAIELPPRQKAGKYARPPIDSQKWIPRIYPAAKPTLSKLDSGKGQGEEEASFAAVTGLIEGPEMAGKDEKAGDKRKKKKKK
jgi:polyphosphate kinase 2